MRNQRFSLAPEHIFRRSAYEARGGFVEFPFALGSDDATWINLAGEDTPLRGIAGPRVYWRSSGINISAFASDFVPKLLALLRYTAWLCQRPGTDAPRVIDGHPAAFTIRDLARKWFLKQIADSGHFFSPSESLTVGRRFPGNSTCRAGSWH